MDSRHYLTVREMIWHAWVLSFLGSSYSMSYVLVYDKGVLKLDAQSPVFEGLMRIDFSRHPAAYTEAFARGPYLERIRSEMTMHGQEWEVWKGLDHQGFRFVKPSMYEVLLNSMPEVMCPMRSTVIFDSEIEDLVRVTWLSLRCNERVRIKRQWSWTHEELGLVYALNPRRQAST